MAELVKEIEGVGYFDDSGSSSLELAVQSITSLASDKVVILAGESENSLSDLAQAIEDNGVIHVLLVESASKYAEALREVGFTHFTVIAWEGMQKIVDTAYHLTEPGDSVLLTATGPTDLFKDNDELRLEFRKAVENLNGRIGG